MQLGVLLLSARRTTARNLKHRIKNFCVEKEFAVTNRGLKIETALVLDESGNTILNLGISHRDNWGPTSSDGWKGIYLSKTPDGYVRSRPWALYTARNNRYLADAPPTIHIRKHVSPAESKRLEHRFAGGVRVRTRAQIQQVAPGHLWDPTRRTFMQQGRGINAWVKGKGHGGDALGFLETRKETADYVAADYLTKFVASTQSAKLAPSQSHPFVDGAGNKMAITARLSGCNIEGVPGYCLDIAVETLVSNPTP
ncbi:uncharacterized protein PG998_008414 [Apiospora kogelbergensis]|uniref:uncharacterized protein n=1 Tax=Apiospora kogelbergensis TaxID=1337665 RepID=UPI00312E8B81